MDRNKVSYLFINLFSFFKRFFLDPIIYGYLTFIPLFFVLGRYISKSGLILSLSLMAILIFGNNSYVLYYLIPFFLIIIFNNNFKKIDLFYLVDSTKYFLLFVIIYALFQVLFNFFQFEINWIYSDLSIVNAKNIFIPNRTIKPFSVFSDTTTFTFFCSIYLLVFFRQKKYFWSLIALAGFLISGTRSFLLAFILAYIIIYLFNIKSKIKVFSSSIILSTILYFFLIYYSKFLLQFFAEYSSRYLIYGTMYGRYETILKRLEDFELINILIPLKFDYLSDPNLTFDNLHLTLVANFGIVGYLLFWKFFKVEKDDKITTFFFSYIIICGFFVDIIYSFYLFFLVAIVIFSKKKYA